MPLVSRLSPIARHHGEEGGVPGPTPGTYRDEVLLDAPIAYYKMGDTAGTTCTDVSGNARDGVFSGTYTLGQPGALSVDGSLCVRFNTGPATVAGATWARLNGSFSLEFWVLIITDPPASTFPGVMKFGSNADGWLVFYGPARQISLRRDNIVRNNSFIQLPAAASTTWSHVVITYDEPTTTLKGYLNGANLSAFTHTSASWADSASTGDLKIGQGDNAAHGDHRIDEVAIYDTVLSATRVLDHFNAAGQIPDPGGGAGGGGETPPPPGSGGVTPLATLDTFTITPVSNYSQGGEGPLPPYQWSSAWTAANGGTYWSHSNSNASAHGVVMVNDPGSLTSSVTGTTRKVVKVTADEARYLTQGTSYVRSEIRGPAMFGLNDDRWIIFEIFVPVGTPTMPSQTNFWTLYSIFGSPYQGSAQSSFHMKRNLAGTGNDIGWSLTNGTMIWRTPATQGVWHIIARRIVFSTDATVGYSKIYHSVRSATTPWAPTSALTIQTIEGGGIGPTTQRFYKTLDTAINWNGSSKNHPDFKVYHTGGIFGSSGLTSLYFARHRVYTGATALADIDPFTTGLR